MSLKKRLGKVPFGLKEIINQYGDAEDSLFRLRYLKVFDLKKSLLYQGKEANKIYAHYLIGDLFVDCLNDCVESLGDEFREYGGCFNYRKKTGSNELSVHSWGIAIDYLPSLGEYGKKSKIPKKVLEIFNSRDIINGGSWLVPDGMHFQCCDGY